MLSEALEINTTLTTLDLECDGRNEIQKGTDIRKKKRNENACMNLIEPTGNKIEEEGTKMTKNSPSSCWIS